MVRFYIALYNVIIKKSMRSEIFPVNNNWHYTQNVVDFVQAKIYGPRSEYHILLNIVQ